MAFFVIEPNFANIELVNFYWLWILAVSIGKPFKHILVSNLFTFTFLVSLFMEMSSCFKDALYFCRVTAKVYLFKAYNLSQQKVNMEWGEIVFEEVRLFYEENWQLLYNIISCMDF